MKEFKVRKTTSVHENAHQKIIDAMVADGWTLMAVAPMATMSVNAPSVIFMYFERERV
jgi:hypothetical protein